MGFTLSFRMLESLRMSEVRMKLASILSERVALVTLDI